MTTNIKPAFELVLSRTIDAPRTRVFEAWAKPEHIRHWFAPKPYTLSVEKLDFRTGGSFRMAMHAPDGTTHAFSGSYKEVVPPEKIVWTGEFLDGPPEQIHTEVIFTEQGNKTKINVRQTFSVVTPQTEPATKGAKQGWTMTLDQLETFVLQKE